MKRADATTPVLLWFTTIAAAIIIVVWFVQSSSITQVDIRSIDEDLKNLRYEVGLACTYASFETRQPTHTTQGFIVINQTSICLQQGHPSGNITRCLPSPCGIEEASIDLSQNSILVISRRDGVIEVVGE